MDWRDVEEIFLEICYSASSCSDIIVVTISCKIFRKEHFSNNLWYNETVDSNLDHHWQNLQNKSIVITVSCFEVYCTISGGRKEMIKKGKSFMVRKELYE